MKLKLFILFAICICLLGCRSGVTTNGESCYELSNSMQREMDDFARMALLKNSRSFRISELDIVRSEAPNRTFEYVGDYRGKAEITWDVGARTIGVYFEFDGKIERVAMIIKDNSPGVIDYTDGELSREGLEKARSISVDPNQGARIFGAPTN